MPGLATRPTSDKLRETLFNVLSDRVRGSFWYDCYAGSGATGLEALSRGAEHVVFIESSRPAARVLLENVKSLGVLGRSTVLEQTVLQGMGVSRRPADFVFLDPPYAATLEYERVVALFGAGHLLKPGAIVIAEHARRSLFAERHGILVRYRLLEQGDSALSFYAAS